MPLRHRHAVGNFGAWRGMLTIALRRLVAGLCLAGTVTAAAQGTVEQRLQFLFGEHEPYRLFLEQLTLAVAAGDRQRVSTMVAYPLEIDGVRIGNAAEFVDHYDTVFSPNLIQAVRGQTFDTLFANANGVRIGQGVIWFSEVCRDDSPDGECLSDGIRITAINPAQE